VAELGPGTGSSLGEAAWQYAREQSAFLLGQLAIFRWTCPDCGQVVSDRRPSGGNPAGDEPGYAEGFQRLAAAAAAWLAEAD
jgi:hypothetical protein